MEEDIYCCVLDQRVRGGTFSPSWHCSPAWDVDWLWKVLATKSCRKILADLQMWFGKSRSPSVSCTQNHTESGKGDYDAWTGLE
ncbi:uncharacterized protein [Procambarus clarkii]|uniref:uncharacterized protein isoform X4 n=1 Tax=Procambarus clarkii TaxID=6728 RepID=UPI0037439C74